ncbi:MAG TPA: VWA domain-containing protein [Candidatus Limiplasma sp.]|nr:VWA domain-containing protein [Candidatus Limiplasma sp.]HRX08526.1 VWA domain-containing protein [Candidatus Limiplasma sp.]
MNIRKLLSLLLTIALITALFAPGLAQDAQGEAISELRFAQLVHEAFPAYTPKGMNGETILTYGRAIPALCEAIGYTGSQAETLAFAMENDLLPGLPAVSDAQVTLKDAQTMIAAFAEYRYRLVEQAMTGEWIQRSYGQSGGAQTLATTMYSMADGAIYPAAEAAIRIDYNGMNDESYGYNEENRFLNPVDSPFSTFALDADTASYANIRRFFLNGAFPDKGAVRIEEMLNYFDYALPGATQDAPVAVTTELAVCPWNPQRMLAMVALSGYTPPAETLPGSNLVFLVDVSGSMEQYNRLPLARQALKLLVQQLSAKDTVTIVTYAGTVGTLLDPTSGDRKDRIIAAIDSMNAGGSTNGAGGIQAAYEQAAKAFIDGGNNRVILLTDGDFNVGVQSAAELEALIEAKRDSGIYLSVLGFGMGNLKDYEMETLADKGNGNYAYIDTLKEAKKVFVDDMTATLFTVAKDVKLQVEFNPTTVAGYRLIGYENRLLNTEDFKDDTKDAGEMGAGYQMIALYEIIPAGDSAETTPTAQSRYQDRTLKDSGELLYVAVRYQKPDTLQIVETGSALTAEPAAAMSETMAFASAVAEFGLWLSDSDYKGSAGLESALTRALQNRGEDRFGYRAEFVQLLDLVRLLTFD